MTDQIQFIQFKIQVCTQLYAFARVCGRNPALEDLKAFVDNYFEARPPSDLSVYNQINDVRTAFLNTGIGK